MDKNKREIRTQHYWICLQDEPLCLENIERFVRDESCGSVLSFSGRTRDVFEGKRVLLIVL